MTDVQAERERDFDRFLTFVDAIVAIAITLLVLPLVDVAGQVDDGSVSHLLHENDGRIGSFFLSFIVIANLWLTQHRLLHNVVESNRALLRLLLLWTLTIVFLPFPTALVAQGSNGDQVTKLLYVGTMGISAVILWLVCVVIVRDPTIRDSDERPDQLHAFSVVATFAVTLVVMLVFPGLSYWPLLLLAVPERVIDTWRRRVRGGRRQQPQV
jgi:uncharacterized membrane protein